MVIGIEIVERESFETRSKMAVMAAENMIAGLKEEIPPNCVNKEVFKNK